MSRKKLLAIIDHVGCKAGMDYYSNALARSLHNNGVNCLIFSNFRDNNSNTHFFKFFIGHTSNRFKKIVNHFFAVVFSVFTCRFKGCKNTIVHIFSYEAKDLFLLYALKLAGINVIAIIHDVEDLASNEQKQRKKRILDYCDRLVAQNFFSAKHITDIDERLQQKLVVIPHGNFHSLFSDRISKTEAREQLQLSKKNKYLLFFGQIKTVKGLDILLKALKQTDENVNLIIAGKPWKDDFDVYEKLIKELQIDSRTVKKIRFIEDGERNLLFQAADILVLPYKKIFQSGVLLMAMSAGIPVIASDLEAMQEMIVDNETGFLFKTEDACSLAQKINLALQEEALLKRVSVNAWAQTNINNDWNNIAQAYTRLIN